MNLSRASRIFAVIACVTAPFVLTALYFDFYSSFLDYFDIGVAGGMRFFFPLLFHCPPVFALAMATGCTVFILLQRRSRGPWLSFSIAFATMLVVFTSAAMRDIYEFRDYPDFQRNPALVRDGVPGFLKWYITGSNSH